MRKLSRDERNGALVLAAISLLVIGGSVWWRAGSAALREPLPQVKVVVADSVGYDDADSGERTGKSSDTNVAAKKRKSRKSVKHEDKQAKRENSRAKRENKRDDSSRSKGSRNSSLSSRTEWRDFLGDTVPACKSTRDRSPD